MNYNRSQTSSSTTPPNTLRTRRTPSRNIDSEDDRERPIPSSSTLQSLLNNTNSRTPSPIPSKHPSRPNTARYDGSRSLNYPSATSSHTLRDAQRTSSMSPAGFWEAPWSSIQGLASQFLGSSDASAETVTSRPPVRKRRPLAATHDRITSAPPSQWGPISKAGKEPSQGLLDDRLAQVQAKKREGLLAANGHVMPDASGRFKRRDSDEIHRGSMPPAEPEDRDALVYLHRVKPHDTLAGVMIKYNCEPNAFRKANRLWPNDSIQIRKVVMLPVDACGVKGRRLPDTEPSPEIIPAGSLDDDFMPTPTASISPWSLPTKKPNPQETPLSSIPSSPDISVTGPAEEASEKPPWKHDSWVLIDGFVSAVEIARLPRRTLGFFPRSRRKSNSNSYSDIGNSPPPSSLDLPRLSYQSNSPRRNHNSITATTNATKSRSSSHSTAHYPSLHRGVGTLGKDVRGPGPAPDGLNTLFQKHLPNVAPRDSFESQRSDQSSSVVPGLENAGGKIERWVRRMADRAARSVQVAPSGREVEAGERQGEAFELLGKGEGEGDEEGGMLGERFAPRGRVFGEEGGRTRRGR
ncbi:MAG: hypothetical protein Q9219_001143 [cf. Caloplaca sp. 3 TL-2023]